MAATLRRDPRRGRLQAPACGPGRPSTRCSARGGFLSPDRGFGDVGPMTPNGYDDISPITRGEWGFMMVDNALQGGRTVAVETC